ncbi:MAG: hypothetical protein ATN31_04200 [Candidatus Epulonipiscioides saccharophilum]|nr:MAG: hypothetical protein ATN31_04200 [Epulopiscium sp. AS2M-Bin001]
MNYKYYSLSLDILHSCRSQMINNILDNDPNIYYALYSDLNSEVYNIYTKIYDLEWLKSHSDKFIEALSTLSYHEKKEFRSLFLSTLNDLANSWKDTSINLHFIEEQLQLLRSLILDNNRWNHNLNKLQVNFIKENKLLDKQLANLLQSDITPGCL